MKRMDKGRELNLDLGNSLAVQWLGLCAFTAKGPSSSSGWGTKIPQASRCGQKKIKSPSIVKTNQQIISKIKKSKNNSISILFQNIKINFKIKSLKS